MDERIGCSKNGGTMVSLVTCPGFKLVKGLVSNKDFCGILYLDEEPTPTLPHQQVWDRTSDDPVG